MISCIHPPFLVPGAAQRFIGALKNRDRVGRDPGSAMHHCVLHCARDEEEFLQSDLPLLWCLRHALSGSIM
jgi:hypothetical protein